MRTIGSASLPLPRPYYPLLVLPAERTALSLQLVRRGSVLHQEEKMVELSNGTSVTV